MHTFTFQDLYTLLEALRESVWDVGNRGTSIICADNPPTIGFNLIHQEGDGSDPDSIERGWRFEVHTSKMGTLPPGISSLFSSATGRERLAALLLAGLTLSLIEERMSDPIIRLIREKAASLDTKAKQLKVEAAIPYTGRPSLGNGPNAKLGQAFVLECQAAALHELAFEFEIRY